MAIAIAEIMQIDRQLTIYLKKHLHNLLITLNFLFSFFLSFLLIRKTLSKRKTKFVCVSKLFFFFLSLKIIIFLSLIKEILYRNTEILYKFKKNLFTLIDSWCKYYIFHYNIQWFCECTVVAKHIFICLTKHVPIVC